MSAVVNQDQVLQTLSVLLGETEKPRKNGATGPDYIHNSPDGNRYLIEAISFSGGKQKGKNQSDFWKAFSQAVSRLNPNSSYGKPDYVVIALPSEFLFGWHQRVAIHGSEVWNRLGAAFPELQIWFVSSEGILRYSWNDAYYASR